MKILYAIQGTGNGHLSRARDIIPMLQLKGTVDILVSGCQADVSLPFPIKYSFKGLSFIFGKNGGIDLLETYKKSNLRHLFKEINSLPIEDYDLVINDFEPVSAWACKIKNKVCIGLSHQAAVMHKKSPKAKKNDLVGKTILKNYAPVTYQYGFHFEKYADNIFTPVIRAEIRNAIPINKKHYTVYLPAYDDKRIIKVLKQIDHIEWQVFSKHTKKKYQEGNVKISPIDNTHFIESFITSEGVLCGAGFETPAEALFLNKKLMVIPMKGQYEQQCNAAALLKLGVPVIKNFKQKQVDKITAWVHSTVNISIQYPNDTAKIISYVVNKHKKDSIQKIKVGNKVTTIKKFKELTLEKIIGKISV
jgi:uncharacterized protein (TIGR00661 family)